MLEPLKLGIEIIRPILVADYLSENPLIYLKKMPPRN
jgi:hypothetical protein